ncbi:High mobility group protein 1 [Yarrowia sp. B02]|nr:High mobility group protein 1 [Yarrowia sp. B02]
MVKHRKNNITIDLEDSTLGQLKGKRDQVIAATKTLELAAQNASWAIKDFHAEFAGVIGKLQHLSDAQIEALKELSMDALPEKGAFLGRENTLLAKQRANDEELTPTGRKKRKREYDPFMPKKPMTVFLAFSTQQRAVIRAQREKEGLPPLVNVDMANEVARLWSLLPDEAKEPFKIKYQEKLAEYHLKKEQYLASKNPANAELVAAAAVANPAPAELVAAAAVAEAEEFADAVEEVEEEKKVKKVKKEKKEKKEKKPKKDNKPKKE